MSEIIQIQTTTETKEDASRIATGLVDRRVAACVQVSGPLISTYRWQGQIETADEWLCTAKTLRELFPEARDLILTLHPYDVPEILAIPVIEASESYSQWLRQQVARVQ